MTNTKLKEEFYRKFVVVVTYRKDPDDATAQRLPEPITRFTDFPNTHPDHVWSFIETALKAQKKELDETSYLLGYTDGKEKPWKELGEKIGGMKERKLDIVLLKAQEIADLQSYAQGQFDLIDDILKLLK